jgi:hypothetical protein
VTTERDLADLRQRYSNWSTEDLLRVLGASQDYRPEAIQIAREILATRDQSQVAELTPAVAADVQREGDVRQQQAEAPLGVGLKITCFLFCGIPGIAFAAYQESAGRSRRAREAWKWILMAWGFWLTVWLLTLLL